MQIAENIGALASQLSKGNLRLINIKVNGSLADLDVSPLQIAILKGVFSSIVEGVNYVNAPVIAKKRGIEIVAVKTKAESIFSGRITIKLVTDKEETVVAGALVTKDIPRIVRINGYETSIRPEKHLLIIPHVNKPSMIAQVAKVIGENGINIGSMNVVQKNDKHETESIMLINIDSAVDEKTLTLISEIDGVHNPKYVNLAV